MMVCKKQGEAVAWLMRLKKKKHHHNINMQGTDANPVLRYLELRAGSLVADTLNKRLSDERDAIRSIRTNKSTPGFRCQEQAGFAGTKALGH